MLIGKNQHGYCKYLPMELFVIGVSIKGLKIKQKILYGLIYPIKKIM
ncbi:hypothetical protein [Clostridium algidicarnis]|nr:hypothetical protein [Clostridium algidicarnis]